MPRRSPRFLPSSASDDRRSVSADTEPSRTMSIPTSSTPGHRRSTSVSSECTQTVSASISSVPVSTACNSSPAVNSITLTIAYTGSDDSTINITITKGICTIAEEYITSRNETKVVKSTIPLKNLATYLYTHICAACLDEHVSSWKSVQFLCSFLPAMYINRDQLIHKRELIIQTLISHIQNLQ